MNITQRRFTRKDMLKMSLLGSAALLLPFERMALTKNGGTRLRDLPAAFDAELPIPPILNPVRRTKEMDFYEVTMKKADVEIIPGKKTQIWGYEGITPGPTFKTRSNRKIQVRYKNDLPNPMTTHTHGAYVDGDSDGHPNKFIPPGEHLDYWFGNEQIARTQWYHDHAMHLTGLHVYNGLAGMYLIEDDFEDNLPLPKGYGEYDIPLVIQDRMFNEDGSLRYPVTADDNSSNGVFGDVMLVNGKPWPRMEVSARKYRFRVLNGSNAQPFELALSTGRPFTVIATEGGLLERPVRVSSLPIAQAERYEIVIDFSEYPVGTRVVLKNLMEKVGKKSDPRNIRSDEPMSDVMRFDVVRKEKDESRIPSVLRPAEEQFDNTHLPAKLSEAVHTNTWEFKRKGGMWTINGKVWNENRIDAVCDEGETEIWEFSNNSGGWVHPVHVHLLNFKIIERDGGKPPRPWERGWKDTVFLGPNESAKVLLKWPKVPLGPKPTEFVRRYPFHCHNLEHEDHDMMLQFEVATGGEEKSSERKAPGGKDRGRARGAAKSRRLARIRRRRRARRARAKQRR